MVNFHNRPIVNFIYPFIHPSDEVHRAARGVGGQVAELQAFRKDALELGAGGGVRGYYKS